MRLLLEAIWFLLPAGVANMAPVFARSLLPELEMPVDLGFRLHGERLFGSHKTVRGILSGCFLATVVFLIQLEMFRDYAFIREISLFNYEEHTWALGLLFGAGAMFGDLAKSFVKRRIGIAPGRPWFPFDQIDWMIGTLIVTVPLVHLSLETAVILLLAACGLSALMKWVGYMLRLNERPI
ncbi:MAG: CDP-archaeol synthase [Bdellovibrionales bacterium]